MKSTPKSFLSVTQIGSPDQEDLQMSDTCLMAQRPAVAVATSEAASDPSRPRQQRLCER